MCLFVGVSSCRSRRQREWCSSSKSKALGLWAISDDRGDYDVVHIQDHLADPDDARRVIDAQQVVADKVAAATAGRPMPQFVLCFSGAWLFRARSSKA